MEINSKESLRNVLVVDDNEGNLLLIEKLLKNKYNVITALSADIALILLNQHKIDLILLDIMMSGINGFEFCQILKSDHKTNDIPIIFLTARTDSESIVQGFELGAVDYITKPFNKYELLAKVKNHVRLKQSKELIKQELIERLHAESKIKEQEVTLKTILENSYDCIIIYDTDRKIINANISSLQKLGYTNDEILNLKIEDILIDGKRIIDEFNKIVEHENHSTIESFLKSKNDKLIEVEVNINTVKVSGKKVVLSIIRDITDRKQLERKIVSAIFNTEEKERARFSKDIHDGLGALLSSINIYLNIILSQDLTQAEFENFLIYTKGLVDETITSVHEIANNLRPTVLTRFGLIESLNSFINKLNITGKIKIDFHYNDLSQNLENELEIIIFRILNELINNTLKHSNAKYIYVSLKSIKNKLSLQFTDDGIGFDVDSYLNKNLKEGGLANIISRINSIEGKINIKSTPNEGVKINIEIPLHKN